MARITALIVLVALNLGSLPTSDSRAVQVHGASESDLMRVDAALARFEAGGLVLPPIQITFHEELGSCRGHLGLFHVSEGVSRIDICDREADFVYEHELAHVWIAHNVDEEMRMALEALLGFESWSDHNDPWNTRGVELAAVVIQQGLAGFPLPTEIPQQLLDRTRAYSLMTDRVSPQYAEWQERST